MSITDYLLNTAAFPDDYAERLIEILDITQSSFLGVKDVLYHFRGLDDDQAAEVTRQIMKAATSTPSKTEIDVHALLAERREIAVIWCIEDVQEVRPELTENQCWEVLQQVKDIHDAEWGITEQIRGALTPLAGQYHGEDQAGSFTGSIVMPVMTVALSSLSLKSRPFGSSRTHLIR
jgi:hypothetical protein